MVKSSFSVFRGTEGSETPSREGKPYRAPDRPRVLSRWLPAGSLPLGLVQGG